MENDKSLGSISEWHEGNFKNLRLHKANELINSGKVDPFSYSEDGNTWNYLIWYSGIDILYGEGMSKYSEEEIEEVDKIKILLNKILSLKPAFKKVIEHTYSGKNQKFIANKENQNLIQELLIIYEKSVKKYNDIHGLSTANKEYEDVRGL